MDQSRIQLKNPLLEAREEALKKAEKSAIRPLGKWRGMDVFTWYKPTVYDLSAVIHSFPFPVCWLGTKNVIEEYASVDPSSFKTLTWIAQYDDPQITVPSDIAGPIPLITATEGLEDTLLFLGELAVPKRILLFTFEGNEYETNMQLFKDFIQQNKL